MLYMRFYTDFETHKTKKIGGYKMKKRVLSFLLIMLMLVQSISTIPLTAAAAEEYTGTGTFAQCTGALTSGYYVFGGGSATNVSAINNTVGTSWIKFTATTATDGTITNPDSSIVWYYDATAGTFKNGDNYIYWPSTGNSGGVGTKNTPVTVTETKTSGVYNITVTATPERLLRLNGTSGYRFYSSNTGKAEFYFFKLQEAANPDCEHTNTEVIGENKDATCTEPGSVAGLKCTDCGTVLETQKTTPPLGHTYVDGECSVCHEKQPTTLTITKANFTGNAYDWNSWTATATTGETISGYGYTYGANANIQVNGSKAGDYIYNTTALPGKIVSITLTRASGSGSGSDRNFDILTSDTPFDHKTAASLKGQATDAKKLVTTEGVTWTFETNHKYFAIVIVDSSAAYLSSIEITYFVCAHTNTTDIGEPKDATCTEDGITAGKKCADCGEVITAQETIEALGHIDEDNNGYCDRETCNELMCTEHEWVGGEVIEEATCAKTGLQKQHCKKCGTPGEDKVLGKTAHTPVTDDAVPATCTATGLTEGSHCLNCEEVLVAQTETPMEPHNYENGECTVCHDVLVEGALLADFQFGENGNAVHDDGAVSNLKDAYISGTYKLVLNNPKNVYGGAFDAKGNSALKLGTSSKAASFTFTVDSNVNTVVIYIAGYKADEAKININGTGYTITSKSNEGDYTKIVVDTSTTKTVTLTTLSGGYRAMVNSIEFWGVQIDKVAGNTVTFGDNIGVNFYMELTDATLADETAYMLFTLPNGETAKVYVKDVTKNGDYYQFTANIAVKEMADTITAKLVTANGDSAEYTYTVQQYAKYIIDNPASYSAEEIAVAKAMLNYGAYAQLMFNYHTDNLANSVLDAADRKLADVAIGEMYKKAYANGEGVTYLGTTTVWEANTYIRHYFNITGEDVTFTLDGVELEVHDSANGKYVEITGILAKDMATTYELVASNGTTVTCSVYSYFYDILNGGNSYTDAQKNAAKAAYIYSQAAITYLNNK